MWDTLQAYWIVFSLVAGYALSIVAAAHAVMYKRDARSAIAWMGLIWLSPIIGPLLYFFLGINRVRRRAEKLDAPSTVGSRRDPSSAQVLTLEHEPYASHPGLSGLAALIQRVTRRPLLAGNRITPLHNGEEAFPQMLDAINSAQHSVSLVSYIFDNDPVGKQFVDELAGAVKRGCQVRVLVDHVGARYSRPTIMSPLSEAGVPAATFLPTHIPRLFHYANLRNHRKILVVDGCRGFTGGTNIRAGHLLESNPRKPTQCMHFEVHGPVNSHLQEAFVVDWEFTTGERLDGETWFPQIPEEGDAFARGIPHGPDEDFETMHTAILGALAAAHQEVLVVTPYFLPDMPLLKALNIAAMRGLRVEIVVPAKSNIFLVQWASQANFWQLLEGGCRMHASPPPFDHTKLMVIDRQWSLIGSTNWDPRSLRLNFEFNVECYDYHLAEQLAAVVDEKIAAAREITWDQIEARSNLVRLRDGIARLFTPYL